MHRSPSCVSVVLLAALACTPSQQTDVPGQGTTTSADAGATPRAQVHAAIDESRMFAALSELASDAMRGRYSLTLTDLGRAADFIAAEYTKVALNPVGTSFRAPYLIETGSMPGPDLHFWIESGGDVFQVPMVDYASLANGGGTPVFGEVVYVGTKTPKAVKRKIAFAKLEQEAATDVVRARAKELAAAGASAIVLVVPARPTTPDRIDVGVPVALIAEPQAERLFPVPWPKVGVTFADTRISLAADPVPTLEPSFNLLSWIPGVEQPDEIVILGAHYDHIGTTEAGSHCTGSPGGSDDDVICNGADDNASGSAMVLEIARALAEAGYRPGRSLVFAHFSGEELGLHGSYALANEPPDAAPFAKGRVVAMINLDMVGRYRKDEGVQIGAISSSDQWRAMVDEAGDHGLDIVFERSVTGRSDHANFYRQKIPVLFFFTGLHTDYHRAGDHADKINREGMAKIADIVLSITMQVADGAKVEWAEPRSQAEGEVQRLPASNPDTVESD